MTIVASPRPQPGEVLSLSSHRHDQDVTRRTSVGVAELRLALEGTCVLWWLAIAAHNWGGRGPGAATVGIVLTAVALVTSRVNQWATRLEVAAAVCVSAAAFAVAMLAPTGWAGANVAATYVAAAWTTLLVLAAVRRDARALPLVVGCILLGAALQYVWSFTPWHGGGDPRIAMIGTFYWHDQFAIFLLPAALVALSLWVERSDMIAWGGLLVLVLGSAGIVYSTSRAVQAALLVGVGAVGAGHLWSAPTGRTCRRLVAALSASLLFSVAVGSPPIFAQRHSPFAGTAARAASQSLNQNGHYRLDFWREAVTDFVHHPLVGSGYRSMATATKGLVPASWPVSPLAHNGYLQAFAEGGLVLGLPLAAIAVAALVLAVARLWQALRRRDARLQVLAVPVATAAVLLHSSIDFDWSYSSLFVLNGILVALLVGTRPSSQRRNVGMASARHTRAAIAFGIVLLSVAGWTARDGQLQLTIHSPAAHTGSTLR